MHVQTLENSPRNHRDGQVSFLLLEKGQFGSQNMAVTWVEGSPGSEQRSHSHPANEQAYVITRGRGLMTVADESQKMEPGSIVFIPPNTAHSIRNIGDEPLVYVSVTAPPFGMPEAGSVFAYTAAP